jgi:monoamine oxidase
MVDAAALETPPKLSTSGVGKSVVILGAGPAGLVCGYELMNKGYTVTVLEAQDRVAGHAFTMRRGMHTHEFGGELQVCDFDEGQWVDLGAWRIPYTHRGLQHYLSEFHIPCINHENLNMNAYVFRENPSVGPLAGKPVRIRQALIDMRGYSSELLAKAINKGHLDDELTKEDQENFVDYLINVGLLSRDDLSYGANTARGWTALDGAGHDVIQPDMPFELGTILPFAATTGDLASLRSLYQQPVMLKPAKGMAQIYEEGFQPAMGNSILLSSPVLEIHQDDSGVTVVYRVGDSETASIKADYCMTTIPLSVLIDMPNVDLSDDVRAAMAACNYAPVGKIGLQFKRRFWETDDWIYGGITNVDDPLISSISYPTWDYHQQKGVIQGYYNFGTSAIQMSKKSNKDRLKYAVDFGAKIHGPAYQDEFETGFSVAWHRMPYNKGAWANWSDASFQNELPKLIPPDGRIYFAGGFLSRISDWQEGAIQAAWMQLAALDERVAKEG